MKLEEFSDDQNERYEKLCQDERWTAYVENNLDAVVFIISTTYLLGSDHCTAAMKEKFPDLSSGKMSDIVYLMQYTLNKLDIKYELLSLVDLKSQLD